jgi:DNA-binding transcriptional MerR regulator
MATSKNVANLPTGDAPMSIGALAQATGVSQRTIRYYEELGIIPTPPRSSGGTRRYPAEYKFYIEGALVLKDLGFSLEELKIVGRLVMGATLTNTQRKRAVAVIETKMKALEHRIRLFNRLHELFQQELEHGSTGENRLAELLEAHGRVPR